MPIKNLKGTKIYLPEEDYYLLKAIARRKTDKCSVSKLLRGILKDYFKAHSKEAKAARDSLYWF